jgi:hypothetical protein
MLSTLYPACSVPCMLCTLNALYPACSVPCTLYPVCSVLRTPHSIRYMYPLTLSTAPTAPTASSSYTQVPILYALYMLCTLYMLLTHCPYCPFFPYRPFFPHTGVLAVLTSSDTMQGKPGNLGTFWGEPGNLSVNLFVYCLFCVFLLSFHCLFTLLPPDF